MENLPVKDRLYVTKDGLVVKANGEYEINELDIAFKATVIIAVRSQCYAVGDEVIYFNFYSFKPYTQPKEIIFKRAVDKWGERSQLEMLQEEATELALATRKFLRINDGKRLLDLVKEIADVEIMIEQFKLMFPEAYKKVPAIKIEKIKRLSDRLDRNSFE